MSDTSLAVWVAQAAIEADVSPQLVSAGLLGFLRGYLFRSASETSDERSPKSETETRAASADMMSAPPEGSVDPIASKGSMTLSEVLCSARPASDDASRAAAAQADPEDHEPALDAALRTVEATVTEAFEETSRPAEDEPLGLLEAASVTEGAAAERAEHENSDPWTKMDNALEEVEASPADLDIERIAQIDIADLMNSLDARAAQSAHIAPGYSGRLAETVRATQSAALAGDVDMAEALQRLEHGAVNDAIWIFREAASKELNFDLAGEKCRRFGVIASLESPTVAREAFFNALSFDLADTASAFSLGWLLAETGSSEAAMRAFDQVLASGDRASSEELYWTWRRLGDLAGGESGSEHAIEHYGQALEAAQAAQQNSELEGAAHWLRAELEAHDKIAERLRGQGRLAEALQSVASCRAIAERLASADISALPLARFYSIKEERLGDALQARGRLEDALTAYEARRASAERLAAMSSGATDLAREVSAVEEKLGDLLLASGRMPEALSAYRAGIRIAEELAAAEPDRDDWVADVVARQGKLAASLTAAERREEALETLLAGAKLVERRAETTRDPFWQRYERQFAADIARLRGPGGVNEAESQVRTA